MGIIKIIKLFLARYMTVVEVGIAIIDSCNTYHVFIDNVYNDSVCYNTNTYNIYIYTIN